MVALVVSDGVLELLFSYIVKKVKGSGSEEIKPI